MKSNCTILTLLFALSLSAATVGFSTSPALAKSIAKHQHAQAPAATEEAAADQEESYSEGDESSSSTEESEPTSESSAVGEPVSLLTMVTGAGVWGFAIAAGLAFFAIAPVLLPAVVWHGGNIIRGGRKPDVG